MHRDREGRIVYANAAYAALLGVPGDRVVGSLAAALEPHRGKIAAFADAGGLRLSAGLAAIWADAFPMVLPPAEPDGLGVILLNSNAEAHFSFTNALGLVAEEGLARLDWSVPEGTDAVIVELGANNALRGMDPSGAKAALDEIVAKLKARKIEVLIAGMEAPSSLGDSYVTAFRAMYSELAGKHGALLYPFFLDGVATDPQLNQPDGLHPTGKGVDVIVGRILPKVEELIARVAAAKAG